MLSPFLFHAEPTGSCLLVRGHRVVVLRRRRFVHESGLSSLGLARHAFFLFCFYFRMSTVLFACAFRACVRRCGFFGAGGARGTRSSPPNIRRQSFFI